MVFSTRPLDIITHEHFTCRMCDVVHLTNHIGASKPLCGCEKYNGGTHRRLKPIYRKTITNIRHFRWLHNRGLFDSAMGYTAYGA